MRKIPTLFKRNPKDMRHLLPEVNPGCEWVLTGEGIATRKYDGTCCMFDGTNWWARREVKPGKQPPENFQEVTTDEKTGKTMGWEPMENSAFSKWHKDAIEAEFLPSRDDVPNALYAAGTYELCGPKINANPEQYDNHILICHANAELLNNVPTDSKFPFEAIAAYLRSIPYEGIVWHHSNGRMAKIKKRDFS